MTKRFWSRNKSLVSKKAYFICHICVPSPSKKIGGEGGKNKHQLHSTQYTPVAQVTKKGIRMLKFSPCPFLLCVSAGHRVISSRGAKSCRLFKNVYLLLTFFACLHCTGAYFSWFREEGWKYFCRFVFDCSTF